MRRRFAALLAALVVAVGVGYQAAPASANTATDIAKCAVTLNPISKAKCVADAAAGVLSGATKGTPLAGFGEAAKSLDSLVDGLSKFTPTGIIQTWAQGAGVWAVNMIGKIQNVAMSAAVPSFNEGWGRQYAITAALGFLVFAFTLAIVIARLSGAAGGRVDRMQMIRDAGFSLPFIPTAILGAPAVFILSSGLAVAIAQVFAAQSQADQAATNLSHLVSSVISTATDLSFSGLGGPMAALVIFGIIGLVGLFVVFEAAVSGQLGMLVSLLVPVALAMWVYPPWRHVARRLVGILVGVLLVIPMLQFVFWALWCQVGDSTLDSFTAAMRLVAGVVLMAGAPALAMWLVPKTLPEGHGGGPARASSGGAGVMAGMLASRLLNKQRSPSSSSSPRTARPVTPAPTTSTGSHAPMGTTSSGRGPTTGTGGSSGGGSGSVATATRPTAVGSTVGTSTATSTGGGAAGGAAAGGAGAAAGPLAPLAATAAAALMGARALKHRADASRSNAQSLGDSTSSASRRSDDR